MLMDTWRIEIIDSDETTYIAKMPLTSEHDQGMGFLNGGVTLAFAEMTAGYCSMELIEEGYAVGQTVNGNHLSPKKIEGSIYAFGSLIHKGNRSHTWEITVKDKHSKIISLIIVTNQIIRRI